MIAALRNKWKNKSMNDKGSALVLVIIAIAFIGTLVAMMIYLVYYNYLMKFTDRSAKDNFYTAESAVAEIKAGIEQDVSEAMVESYYKVMSEHVSDSASNQQAYFEQYFREELKNVLNISGSEITWSTGNQAYYDPADLSSYWIETTVAANPGDEGARIETKAYDASEWDLTDATQHQSFKDNGPAVVYRDGNILELCNVRVSYTDSKGFVSIIETDIAIETPEINFATVMSLPELEKYSLVSATGIYNGYRRGVITKEPEVVGGTQSVTKISGNVYGGEDGIFVNGINAQLEFVAKEGDTGAAANYVLVAEKVNALNGRNQLSQKAPAATPSILVNDNYSLWATDLYVESATMQVSAQNTYVKDDLTIDGNYSRVDLDGIYHGFGKAQATSTANSAILVNGAHTYLDMADLEQLNLAGMAYVGSIHYDVNTDESRTEDYIEDIDAYRKAQEEEAEENEGTTEGEGATETEEEYELNESDILMGQSLAVKSDQLLYMVPVECMGYDGDIQVLGKNPMTYEEYHKMVDTMIDVEAEDGTIVQEPRYDVVRLDVVMRKVGGSPNSYGASYTPVFRRVNGTLLVYFYLNFASEDQANKFFRDYYEADQEAFSRYIGNYIESYRINSALTANNSSKLSIAGNMLYMRGDNIYLIDDTFDEDLTNFEAMEQNRQDLAAYYVGLSKYLMMTTDDLASGILKSNVFENIAVDEETFAEQVSEGHYEKYFNTSSELNALVINNAKNAVFKIPGDLPSGTDISNLHLIIATGDVELNIQDYDGLVFAGGDIYIGSGCRTVDYDSAAVSLAMTAKSASGDYAFEVIKNGIAYANSVSAVSDDELTAAIETQKEADIIRASDLVKFVNWTKE